MLRRHHGPWLLPQKPHDEFEALLRQAWGTNVRVDIVMSLLGLAHCSETLVGDALMRGISGGERKRLTAAELLVGGSNVLMLDEMSTGLVGGFRVLSLGCMLLVGYVRVYWIGWAW